MITQLLNEDEALQACADELLEKLGLSSATMRNHLSHSFNPAPPILTCNPVPTKAPSPCITTRTTCTPRSPR